MTDTLFTPKNLKNNDIWLVRRIGSAELELMQVYISIYNYNVELFRFGSECEDYASDYEFIRKIDIPELEK